MTRLAGTGVNALAASVAVLWTLTAAFAGLGPAAWVALSGRDADAGLYFAAFALGAALGSFAGGRAMEAFGRVRTLVAAHAVNAAGYAVAAAGVLGGSLPAFFAGVVLSSVGGGAIGLTRLVAVELSPPALRGRAVARVIGASLVGVAASLALVALVEASGHPVTATGPVWLAAGPVALVAGVVASRVPEPTTHATGSAGAGNGSPRDAFAGVVTLALSHAAMVAVMGVAGVALGHQGHGATAISFVLALHFTGMFGPSPVWGRLADRRGPRKVALAALALLACGGLSVAFVPGVAGYGLGLLLIGVGWSGAYLAGTVLFTGAVRADRRARATGLADFGTSLAAAAVTAGAGVWYAGHGATGLGLLAAALVTLPVVGLLATRRRSDAVPA